MAENILYNLKQFFQNNNELPGINSQLKMAPPMRKMFADSDNSIHKRACVLLLLFLKDNTTHITFIKRAANGDKHSGQMAFAGGKQDPTDLSDIDTALREANEEIGINRDDVEIIGNLTELFIPVSNFIVQPLIGFLPYAPQFIPSTDEVEKVVSIELDALLKIKTLLKAMKPKDTYVDAPCYKVNNEYVWGATAMILSEFIDIVKSVS